MDERTTGIDLSRGCFERVVRPLMASRFPGLRYAAGRLGAGSDVLGLDDVTSRDHDWGVRLTLVVPAGAVADVVEALEAGVPDELDGMPTRSLFSGDDTARLHIDVSSMAGFVLPRLGFDPRDPVTTADWLSLTGQAVLETTAGPVFLDGDGRLGRLREALAWYPEDVWRYALASGWVRLAQELPLMSRAAEVGDGHGSRVIAARLTQVAMHLAFLLDRRWPPYAKWFGTLFRTLPSASNLGPVLDDVLDARDRAGRERGFAAALQVLLEVQNGLGLSDVVRATVPFWDRPHLHPDPSIAEQLMAPVRDETVRDLRVGLGTVEQRTDTVDLLVDPSARRRAVGAIT